MPWLGFKPDKSFALTKILTRILFAKVLSTKLVKTDLVSPSFKGRHFLRSAGSAEERIGCVLLAGNVKWQIFTL